MTAFVLVSGTLSRAPELKTAKSGKPYASATIRVAADGAAEFWSILAFSESAQADLSRLGEGDKVSLQGSLNLEVYTSKNGEQRISRTLFADHVLALRQPPSERTRKPASAAATPAQPRADFDDGLPEQWGPDR